MKKIIGNIILTRCQDSALEKEDHYQDQKKYSLDVMDVSDM